MRYLPRAAVLTVASVFGRLATLAANEGVGMAERGYEQMQARAINNLDNTYSGDVGTPDQAAQLARGQVYALLAVGAALKELAQAIREGR